MAKKQTPLEQVDYLETMGDCAKFRLDVLQPMEPGQEKNELRQAFIKKRQDIAQAKRKVQN